MMGLRLAKAVTEPLRILCLGAHSDDIEIGCGGTLLQLRRVYSSVVVHWVVFSAAGVRGKEATKGATLFAGVSDKQLILKEFRDGFFPYNGSAVKEVYEGLKDWVNPDIIFTHWHGDAHQDHRLLSELTWNSFRNHLILEYEIPKYDGDMGRPNIFVPLELPLQEHKVNYLFEAFESQRPGTCSDRRPFLGFRPWRGMNPIPPGGMLKDFTHGK